MSMSAIDDSTRRVREKSQRLRAQIANEPISTAQQSHAQVLEMDWGRRTANYRRREENYEAEIGELEAAIVDLKSKELRGHGPATMDPVHGLHRSIIESLEGLSDREGSIRTERQRDLNRACRARLGESSLELAEARSAKEQGARSWKQRAELLSGELRWAQEQCERLQQLNADLDAQHLELRDLFRKGEDDRKFIIGQLAHVKKDTTRCTQIALPTHSPASL